jgi:hypothetical protein
MDRFDLNSIHKTMLVKKDFESLEAENLLDTKDTRSICADDLCGLTWKPKVNNKENSEDKE